MDRTLQILLRNRILRRLHDIWDELPLQNTWEEVLDEGITLATVNWQLYGSRKPGHQPYVLTNQVDILLDEENDLSMTINDVKKFDLKNKFSELSAQYTGFKQFIMSLDIQEEYDNLLNSKKKTNKSKGKLKIVSNKSLDITDVTCQTDLDSCVENFLENHEQDKNYIIGSGSGSIWICCECGGGKW